MSTEQLRTAYNYMTSGDLATAQGITRAVLRDDPENVNAWWLMANILEDDAQSRQCLEKVLALKPDHKGALSMMKQLNQPKEKPKRQAPKHDWSKLEKHAKQGYKPKPGKWQRFAQDRIKRAAALYAMTGIILVIVLILFTISLAIGNLFSGSSSNYTIESTIDPRLLTETSSEAVVGYFNALYNQDYVLARVLTCRHMRDDFDNQLERFIARNAVSPFDEDLVESLVYDFSPVSTEFRAESEIIEWVQLSGNYRITSTEYNIDEYFNVAELYLGEGALEIRTRFESSVWKVCW